MQKIIGKFVLPNKIINGTLTIENGKITSLEEGFQKDLTNVLNYRDNYILPGLIEVHDHLREPGYEQKEDVPHGTRAALAGGVTTVIDMPNTNPPTITVELLHEKLEKIYPGRSYADYSIFMGVSKDSLSELEKVDKNIIVGVKMFMAGHETTPTTIPDDETLAKIFEILARRGIIAAVHAEDQHLINDYNQQLQDRTDAAAWSEIRPKAVIVNAVKRAITIAEKYDTKLYLLHLSTPEEFALVDEAKQKGLTIYGELVGYQLFFTIDDYAKMGNKIKVAPALRTKADQDSMWQRLREGKVDVLCAEHSPHEWATKNQPDMRKAQAGAPGIQENLPAIITAFVQRFGKEHIEEILQLLAKLSSYNPSHIFGFKDKGEIAVGKDADFVVIDVNSEWEVNKEDLFAKCGWSEYEGIKLIGRPIATFLRGNLVYENGKIIGEAQGKQITKA